MHRFIAEWNSGKAEMAQKYSMYLSSVIVSSLHFLWGGGGGVGGGRVWGEGGSRHACDLCFTIINATEPPHESCAYPS